MDPLNLPKLHSYVNDFSNALPGQKASELNELFALHEKNTTEQVVVSLIPHREGNELLDIGLKLFNENGIGQKGANNGLLLIIATEEKKIRLITGKGMEMKYSEMRCRDIIENHLRPLLNGGKYEEVIRAFSSIISSTEVYVDSPDIKNQKQSRETTNTFAVIGGMVSFFASFFADSVISGIVIVTISIVFYFIFMMIKRAGKIQIGMPAYIFAFVLLVIGILAILRPADCTLLSESIFNGKNYHCERNVFGYNFSYSKTIGGYSSSSSSNGSSSSHWDSGGSSFGGGGGSSNGGGYGD